MSILTVLLMGHICVVIDHSTEMPCDTGPGFECLNKGNASAESGGEGELSAPVSYADISGVTACLTKDNGCSCFMMSGGY